MPLKVIRDTPPALTAALREPSAARTNLDDARRDIRSEAGRIAGARRTVQADHPVGAGGRQRAALSHRRHKLEADGRVAAHGLGPRKHQAVLDGFGGGADLAALGPAGKGRRAQRKQYADHRDAIISSIRLIPAWRFRFMSSCRLS